MAATGIRVTPEQLQQVSAQLDAGASSIEGTPTARRQRRPARVGLGRRRPGPLPRALGRVAAQPRGSTAVIARGA